MHFVGHGDNGTTKVLHPSNARNEGWEFDWRYMHGNQNELPELSAVIQQLIRHARRACLRYGVANKTQ
jgi:hypothetical protein